MVTNLFPSNQWNPGSEPPYELKVGNIEKAVGCLRLILVGFFSLLISCCLSCCGIALLMQNQDPFVTTGLVLIIFIVVFFVIYRISSWRFKKAYGKSAVLDVDRLVMRESDSTEEVISYKQMTSISIKKSRSQQLGYEFQLADQNIHDLDPDLARFPATNIPVENSALPFVLAHWDEVIFAKQGSFLVTPDASAYELRKACAFWIAIGTPLIFVPTWWGMLAEFYTRAWALYQQAKYCGEPFLITAQGITSTKGPQVTIPFSDVRIEKRDEVAIVVVSRSNGKTFSRRSLRDMLILPDIGCTNKFVPARYVKKIRWYQQKNKPMAIDFQIWKAIYSDTVRFECHQIITTATTL